MLNDSQISRLQEGPFVDYGTSYANNLPQDMESCSSLMSEFHNLSPDDTFHFSCHPGIACFNNCCRDLNHALTPYDIIRLKKSLKLPSGAFLERFTLHHTGPASGLPIVTLNMLDQKDLKCPFLRETGCSVYPDRPGFCRIYPLARIVRKRPNQAVNEASYLLIKEPHCLGYHESKAWTVRAWMEDQAVQPYNDMNDLLMEVIALKNRSGRKKLTAEEAERFYLACYDMDRFRDFASVNRLWERFPPAGDFPVGTEQDDVALMRLGIEWIKARLFRHNETSK